ncbi:hypothetical protein A5764_07935 [Mycobacterium sp. 852002-51057_SCH5723018]|nr:hypothetical protein A5764_07935 [Mycobacterium sp. 852002-51057_SCH5723018]
MKHAAIGSACHDYAPTLASLVLEFSDSQQFEGVDTEAFHDHPLGLSDGVAAGQRGLKLQLFVVGDERDRSVSGR